MAMGRVTKTVRGVIRESEENWLSAHLFYTGNWECFLADLIMPLVKDLKSKDLISHFFFIRYWEKGPHIRLRLKTRKPGEVRSRVIDEATTYFRQNPSVRDEPASVNTVYWHANDSVRWIPYEPEIKRYGGKEAILLAEEQFQSSSMAVISIFTEYDDWSADSAMGAALQMHLTLVHAMGMSLDEARAFFMRVFTHWLPKAYQSSYISGDPKLLAIEREEVLKAFEKAFITQREQLLPYIAGIWETLENGLSGHSGWITLWYGNIKKIKEDLGMLEQEGLLVNPEILRFDKSIDREVQIRWSILDSYVHMTNNRLGIPNRDEPYIAYLLGQALAGITS